MMKEALNDKLSFSLLLLLSRFQQSRSLGQITWSVCLEDAKPVSRCVFTILRRVATKHNRHGTILLSNDHSRWSTKRGMTEQFAIAVIAPLQEPVTN